MIITREQILQEIKRDGIEAIKNRLGQMNPKKQKKYQEVLNDFEATDVLARQEDREERNISISTKALNASLEANSIARDANDISSDARRYACWANIIAIIALAATIIIAIYDHISKAP